MIVHLMHTGIPGTYNVILPVISYHERFLQFGLGGRHGKVEYLYVWFQDADVVGQDNFAEIVFYACRTHFAVLQFAEAVGEDIQPVAAVQVFQRFAGVGHQFPARGYHGKKVTGEVLGQPCIFYPHLLQGVEEALAVQFVFRDDSPAIFFPQLQVALSIEGV